MINAIMKFRRADPSSPKPRLLRLLFMDFDWCFDLSVKRVLNGAIRATAPG